MGRDRQPSALIVYFYLWRHARGTRAKRATAGLRQMAADTELSRVAVQQAIRTLSRRRLPQPHQVPAISVPECMLLQRWRR